MHLYRCLGYVAAVHYFALLQPPDDNNNRDTGRYTSLLSLLLSSSWLSHGQSWHKTIQRVVLLLTRPCLGMHVALGDANRTVG